MIVVCGECGQQQQLTWHQWRCDCGGAWEPVESDTFDSSWIHRQDYSLWRYARLYGLDFDKPLCRLSAGWTPLLETDLYGMPVHLKMEHFAPTSSFKDRGTEVMINILLRQGVSRVVDDSSGNAGASVAAYAAAASLQADIYVPDYASERKRAQIVVYGSTLHCVYGTRADTKLAAMKAADHTAAYASHAYHPGFLLGQQSLAWELWEQLGYQAPDVYIVPVGQGVHLLGVWLGFCRLRKAGLINHLPRMIGVQTEYCAPLVQALQDDAQVTQPFVVEKASIAEGIMINQPIRGKKLLQAVRDSGGTCVVVSEKAIQAAQHKLAAHGLYVEPTSATVAAALHEVRHLLSPNDLVVLPITGTGLKGSPILS